MEAFFATSTRLERHLDSLHRGASVSLHLEELELVADPKDMLEFHRDLTVTELFGFTSSRLIWLSPVVFFVDHEANEDLMTSPFCQWCDYDSLLVMVIQQERAVHHDADACKSERFLSFWLQETPGQDRDDPNHLIAMQYPVGLVLDLLRSCGICALAMETKNQYRLPVATPALERFLMQNETLECLSLCHFYVNQEQSRVLGQATLQECRLQGTSLASPDAFCAGIRLNQGPRRLVMDETTSKISAIQVLGAIGSNTRLESISLFGNQEVLSSSQVHAIAAGLRDNHGLVYLRIASYSMDDCDWASLWSSLSRHPTLERLDLPSTISMSQMFNTLFDEERQSRRLTRTMAVVNCLQTNTKLQKIYVHPEECDHAAWNELVVPCLSRNIHRPRFQAIADIRDESMRLQVLGSALGAVASDTRLVYLCLQCNANALMRSVES